MLFEWNMMRILLIRLHTNKHLHGHKSQLNRHDTILHREEVGMEKEAVEENSTGMSVFI